MRQRVEEEREGDKEQVSFKKRKGKKKEPVEKCGGGDLCRLFPVACKERT